MLTITQLFAMCIDEMKDKKNVEIKFVFDRVIDLSYDNLYGNRISSTL